MDGTSVTVVLVGERTCGSKWVKYEIEKKIEKAYEKSKLIAEDETGIDKNNFPASCPFTIEQILKKEFFPENNEHGKP